MTKSDLLKWLEPAADDCQINVCIGYTGTGRPNTTLPAHEVCHDKQANEFTIADEFVDEE